MKIRTSFVSNSSSSSFVAVGVELDIDEITKDMINDSGYLVAIGTELWEGTDIIEINTIEKLMFFKLFREYVIDSPYGGKDEDSFTFYQIAADGDFKKSDLEDDKTYSVIDMTMDQHSTDDIKTLLEKYAGVDLSNKDPKEYLNKLYREKKLTRILKENKNEN